MKKYDEKICKNCKYLMNVREEFFNKNRYYCLKIISGHERYSAVRLRDTCNHFDKREGKIIRFLDFSIRWFIPLKFKKVTILRNSSSDYPEILTETELKKNVTHCLVCGKPLKKSIHSCTDEKTIDSFVRKNIITCGNEKCSIVRKELIALEKTLMKLARSNNEK